jgi:hypothetical protein
LENSLAIHRWEAVLFQRQFRPVGTFENSPAIHRWETVLFQRQFRPVGTFETPTFPFDRPYGTCWKKGMESSPQQ